MRAIAFAACMCLNILISISADAQYVDMPLTPREQESALASASSRAVWSKLYPSRTATTVVAPPYQQDYRARYLSASLGNRVAITQLIGEEGVERYAEGRGLKTLLSPLGRSTPIGPDSVFRNPLSGRVQVLEAKGGSSALKWTYGSLQGTNANAIRSAGGVLAHSGANWSEKFQAARVIKAAQSGHLETGVIRTFHVLGTPRAPRQSVGVNFDNVAKEARQIERDLVRRNPKLGAAFRNAGFQHRMDLLAYRGARWMPSRDAIRESRLVAARLAGFRARQVRQVGYRWLLPVAVGVAGVTVTVAYHQLVSGSISDRKFLHISASPAVLVTFTGVGALIGGVGVLGIGAIPGAAMGAILAIPFQLSLEWAMDRYYRDFNRAQREAVDKAVEVTYLGNPTLFRAQ